MLLHLLVALHAAPRNAMKVHQEPLCTWTKARVADVSWEMCVYDPRVDVHVSGSIVRTGAWEGHLVGYMLNRLRAHANSTLLDIGGNVGFYALAAARAGFAVDVFEPVPRNAAMIQASLNRNQLNGVRLHTFALSDSAAMLHMGVHNTNQGGVGHSRVKAQSTSDGVARSGQHETMLSAIPMDSILPLRGGPKRPLYLKIDIEGAECLAFRGMKQFFKDTEHIIGVSMEFASRACCAEWTSVGGVFDILHHRHKLCPMGGSYTNVCEMKTWDLVWEPCH